MKIARTMLIAAMLLPSAVSAQEDGCRNLLGQYLLTSAGQMQCMNDGTFFSCVDWSQGVKYLLEFDLDDLNVSGIEPISGSILVECESVGCIESYTQGLMTEEFTESAGNLTDAFFPIGSISPMTMQRFQGCM